MRATTVRLKFMKALVAGFALAVSAGKVWSQNMTDFTALNRPASDISVGANGTVWAIGADRPVAGGYGIYRLDGATWTQVDGAAVRIAVDPSGSPWVVNSSNGLFRRTGSTWTVDKLAALDIGVGANGAVWAIGADQSINRLRGTIWEKVEGGAVRIAVDPLGNPWVVNSSGQISRWTGTVWSRVEGSARDIAIGTDGTVLIVGTKPVTGGFEILVRNGNAWTPDPRAGAVSIAAGPGMRLYAAQDQTAASRTFLTHYAASPATAPATAPATPVAGAATPITPILFEGQPLTLSPEQAPPVPKPEPGLVISGGPMVAPPPGIARGSLVCPILSSGYRLIKGCILHGEPAIFLSVAPSATCAAGSFFDPQRGGECWTCPANHVRNVTPVESKDACWQPVGEVVSVATQVGRTGCGSGSFLDPRNGGECWSCPAGYNRTLDPVTVGTACSRSIVGPFSVASNLGRVGQCTGAQFFDPIDGGTCWICPVEYRRTLNSVKTQAACAKTVPTQYAPGTIVSGCSTLPNVPGYGKAFRDPRENGQCWACPVQLVRMSGAVNNPGTGPTAACGVGSNVGKIVWQLPQYPEPGLVQFMDGLVGMALANPARVDAFLLKRAGGNVAAKQALWQKMMQNPGESAELKALTFAALLTVAKQGSNDLLARNSLAAFERYMRVRQTFVAQEAANIYAAWGEIDGYNKLQAARRASGVGGIDASVLGSAPPDFVALSYQAAVPDLKGTQFLMAFQTMAETSAAGGFGNQGTAVESGYMPEHMLPIWKAVEKGLDKYDKIAGMMTSSSISKFSKLGSALQSVGKGVFVGFVVVQAVVELNSAANILIAQDKAAERYATVVSAADQPVSVKRLLESSDPNDQQSVLLFWALATSPYAPTNTVGTGAVAAETLCTGTSAFSCTRASELVSVAMKSPKN